MDENTLIFWVSFYFLLLSNQLFSHPGKKKPSVVSLFSSLWYTFITTLSEFRSPIVVQPLSSASLRHRPTLLRHALPSRAMPEIFFPSLIAPMLSFLQGVQGFYLLFIVLKFGKLKLFYILENLFFHLVLCQRFCNIEDSLVICILVWYYYLVTH